MEDTNAPTHRVRPASGVSRRQLLKRGVVVGAAAAWTVPLVQAVSMTPAHADTPSSPGGGGGGPRNPGTPINTPTTTVPTTTPPTTAPPTKPTTQPTPGGPTDPSSPTTTAHQPGLTGTTPATHHAAAVAPPAGGGSSGGSSSTHTTTQSALAFTGVDLPIAPTVAAGVAAVALGAGVLAASRDRDRGNHTESPEQGSA